MYVYYIYVCKYVCVYTYINNSNDPLIPDGLLMGFLTVKIKYFLLLLYKQDKTTPPQKKIANKRHAHTNIKLTN